MLACVNACVCVCVCVCVYVKAGPGGAGGGSLLRFRFPGNSVYRFRYRINSVISSPKQNETSQRGLCSPVTHGKIPFNCQPRRLRCPINTTARNNSNRSFFHVAAIVCRARTEGAENVDGHRLARNIISVLCIDSVN